MHIQYLTVLMATTLLVAQTTEIENEDEDGSSGYTSITAGLAHTCALGSNGVAYCWGANQLGELGIGSTVNASAPTLVAGGLRFKSLIAGGQSTCGVTRGGDAYCWGDNSYGQLGAPAVAAMCGATPCATVPVAVNTTVKFSEVAPGLFASCGLSVSGAAYCWGDNGNGELGTGTSTGLDTCLGRPCSRSPLLVATGLKFRSISAGSSNACAVERDGGALYCWGDGQLDQLGTGVPQPSSALLPALVAGGHEFATVKIGAVVTCGVSKTGIAYCWGNDLEDGLGTTTPPESCFTQGFLQFGCASAPNAVMGGLNFLTSEAALGLQRTTSCMISVGGQAHCWGLGNEGQLGNGTFIASSATPVPVAGNLRFKAIAVGSGHGCGLTSRGEAYCWGGNGFGQGGFGVDASSVPLKVSNPVR